MNTKPQPDNLAKDLIGLLTGAGLSKIQKQIILEKLVPYVVIRDHKILTHGIETGRASKGNNKIKGGAYYPMHIPDPPK